MITFWFTDPHAAKKVNTANKVKKKKQQQQEKDPQKILGDINKSAKG